MPKIVDRDTEKDRILLRSFELFAKKGFSNITMRQVARELMISTGKLYHYFPSKEHIFSSVLEYANRQILRRFDETFVASDSLDQSLEGLILYLTENEDTLRKYLFILMDFFQFQSSQGKGDPKLGINQAAEELKDRIQGILPSNQKVLADFLFIYFNGWLINRMAHEGGEESSKQWPFLKRVLVGLSRES